MLHFRPSLFEKNWHLCQKTSSTCLSFHRTMEDDACQFREASMKNLHKWKFYHEGTKDFSFECSKSLLKSMKHSCLNDIISEGLASFVNKLICESPFNTNWALTRNCLHVCFMGTLLKINFYYQMEEHLGCE